MIAFLNLSHVFWPHLTIIPSINFPVCRLVHFGVKHLMLATVAYRSQGNIVSIFYHVITLAIYCSCRISVCSVRHHNNGDKTSLWYLSKNQLFIGRDSTHFTTGYAKFFSWKASSMAYCQRLHSKCSLHFTVHFSTHCTDMQLRYSEVCLKPTVFC